MNLIKLIKSNEFALWIALVSVLAQAFHSFVVFMAVSSIGYTIPGVIQGVVFSVTFDFALLYFTLKKTDLWGQSAAKIFSVLLFLVNVIYYYLEHSLSINFGIGVFIGSIMPLAMYVFAEEIKIPREARQKKQITTIKPKK